jgi:hemolysin III
MNETIDPPKNIYPYRLSDMVACSVTHGLGAALAIAGMVILIIKAANVGGTLMMASALIFGICLILSYLSSTLYHALVRTKAKKIFQIIDHSMIYLLIAGTYTPIVLVTLGGFLGWTIFIVVWLMAIVGIICKSLMLGKYPRASAALYIAMGWLAILFIVPLWHALPFAAIVFLVLGGLCYTIGVVFFSLDRIPHFHSIWHLFVLAGSIFHYFLVLEYVIGY